MAASVAVRLFHTHDNYAAHRLPPVQSFLRIRAGMAGPGNIGVVFTFVANRGGLSERLQDGKLGDAEKKTS